MDAVLGLREKETDCARVEEAAPEGDAEASQVTNAAFRSLLLSSLCYFSLLQICLDVRTQAWAVVQRGQPGDGSGGVTWGHLD